MKSLYKFLFLISVSVGQAGCELGNAAGIATNNKLADSTNGSFVTSGSNNTAFGVNSLYELRSGNSNIGIGYEALYFNRSGNNNIAVGHDALYSNTTGNYNVGIGSDSLRNNIDGSYNTAINYDALHDNKSGNFNTALGYKSLFGNLSGNYNVGLGVYAGSGYRADGSDDEPRTPKLIYSNAFGSGNIFIGNNTGADGLINNSVAIGNGVILTQSDSVIIGSMKNKFVSINGSLRLGGGSDAAGFYGLKLISLSIQIPESSSPSVVDFQIPGQQDTNEFTIIRPDSSLVGQSRSFSIVRNNNGKNVLRVTSVLPELNAFGIVSIVFMDIR